MPSGIHESRSASLVQPKMWLTFQFSVYCVLQHLLLTREWLETSDGKRVLLIHNYIPNHFLF